MALDRNKDEELSLESPKNTSLTVLHLESFYNYRTCGEKFELKTSILSNHDYCINIQVKSQDSKENKYTVTDEIVCSKSNTHFSNLHAKKQRIIAAMSEIKYGEKSIIDSDFINYFDISCKINIQANNNSNNLRPKPQFCRNEFETTSKKKQCAECDSLCAYSIEDLLDPHFGIGQIDIKNELEKHHHPKTRTINSLARTTYQATKRIGGSLFIAIMLLIFK